MLVWLVSISATLCRWSGQYEMIAVERIFIGIGALLAFVAVGLGAFGAHALAASFDQHSVRIYETGVQYQLVHALGLIIVGVTMRDRPSVSALKFSGWAMLSGILLFSGSLYMLVLFDMSGAGMVAPFGGGMLLISWLCLGYWAFREG